MREQEVRGLQEAYMQVYDEGYKDLGDKARDKGHQLLNKSKKTATRGSIYSGVKPSNTPEGENLKQRASKQFAASAFHNPEKSQAKAAANKEKGEKKKKAFGNRLMRSDGQGIRDSYDYYDIILSHLLDEGYAETPEAAEAIMVNMGEEWREDIVEGMTMKDFKANRRKLQRKEASDDAKKRGHVDKFTGKPYGTEEAASRRKDIHSPSKAPEREARRKFAEDPD